MQNKAKTKTNERRRSLSFSDLFFLSFGGQAPFISLLTFGTVMIAEVGTEGAFAMLIATFVVFFNGLVIYYLSKRFKRGGGYYIYALYSLTSRLGFNTGWNYLLYALSYGGTLLAGGSFVLYFILESFFPILHLPQWVYAFVVSSLSASLVIAGVRVSANYAKVMSLVEMITIILLSVLFLYDSHWNIYNPIPTTISPVLLEAVVFGLGIPTGYGSIAPLGEEAESKDIGKAAIEVLLFGGLLATLFFYSLGALGFTGNLVEYLLSRFGLIGVIFIGFVALNDGTLGGLSYMLADSRTVEAMAKDIFLPSFLAKIKNGKPIYAEIFIAIIFISILTGLAYFMGLFDEFNILGALAGLNNLFVHLSADASLIRIASKRSKKNLPQITVGLIAALISLFVFFYSLPTFEKYIVYVFFGWIILGFLYAEGLEIIKASSNE